MIACVTGASGMVGSKIVEQLIKQGHTVRTLSRRKSCNVPNAKTFHGDIRDEDILRNFLNKAQLLFHCAAELRDELIMLDVNVRGTERLLHAAAAAQLQYFCYLSSAGVTGRTTSRLVDEETPSNPRNAYEKSKWAAEQLVARGLPGCRVVILRPTNVIDDQKPGYLSLPLRGLFADRLQVFIKGGECAHIIHAEDVAVTATHFLGYPIKTPQTFLVSCDHDPLNTVAGLWSLYRACLADRAVEDVAPVLHLPLIVPYYMRSLRRGVGNRGDVRYSSQKLLATGFSFPLGVRGAVQRVVSFQKNRGNSAIPDV